MKVLISTCRLRPSFGSGHSSGTHPQNFLSESFVASGTVARAGSSHSARPERAAVASALAATSCRPADTAIRPIHTMVSCHGSDGPLAHGGSGAGSASARIEAASAAQRVLKNIRVNFNKTYDFCTSLVTFWTDYRRRLCVRRM